MTLQRLYKTAKSGATQIIDMEINGAVYTRHWGQLDGKMQSKATTATAKNVGRVNETTPEEQAIIEAKAVWTKKQKANYSTDASAPVTIKLPMKVNEYQKHKKKVIFPCMTSVKLNGVNAEYRLVDGELQLLSRGGEQYPIPPHQREEALTLLKHLNTTAINGEMYIHGEFLQDIQSATKKHNELTPQLKFWVFDFPELEGDYSTRCSYAYSKVAGPEINVPNFPFVNVGMADSYESIDAQHSAAVNANYEGLIIRNTAGMYEYNTRSLDVFKYKTVQDAEFKIIAVTADKNNHPVMTFESPGGEFKAKPKGTSAEREAMLVASNDFIGKFATVEYEMLSKGTNGLPGKPLKPVMVGLRKVDEKGEAIE